MISASTRVGLDAKRALAARIWDPLELEGWIETARHLGHEEIAQIGVRRLAELRQQEAKRERR